MATRYFNWKLAIVLVVAAAVFAIAAFSLHRWQRSSQAGQALPLGEQAYEQKRWDDAAEHFGRYLAVNNQDVPVLIKYAESQLNRRPSARNHLQQAIAAYRTVLLVKPDDIETAKDLTELYLGMGAYGEASPIVARHLERRDDPTLRRMLAVILWQQRKFTEATAELEKIAAQHPGEIAAFELAAKWAKDRPDLANKDPNEWLDEAVAKNPGAALAYASRAAHFWGAGEKDRAMGDLARALECDLSDTDVRFRVILELIRAKAWDQARAQLRILQTIDPTKSRLWQAWAELAAGSRSPEEMQTVAEEGMKALGMDVWDFMPTATRLLIYSGHLEKVEEYLTQMRNKDLDPIDVSFLEGMLADKQNRTREAITAWRRTVSLPPITDRQKNVQKETYRPLASALSRSGDTQSAISQLQILLSRYPDHVRGRLLLAQLLAQSGSWQKVQDQAVLVQQIAQNDPNKVDDPNDVMTAALLEVQARSLDLAGRTDVNATQADWGKVEARVDQLDEASQGALGVKLLRIQIAKYRNKFAEAAVMLSELESKYPSDLRLMLLHADCCVAENKEAEAMTRFQNAMTAFPQEFEPIRAMARFLDRRKRQPECESLIKEAFTRIQDPQPRRDLGLLLAGFYHQWEEKEKLCQWLTDLATQFPGDIQSRRMLLACEAVAKDAERSQKIVDEIKSIEGPQGSWWRYEQARLWARSKEFGGASDKDKLDATSLYGQVVKLLQENLLINSEDQASRLLLAGVYELVGQQQLALTTYRTAFELTPNDTQVLVRYVGALLRAREYDAAQAILGKVSDQARRDPDMLRLLVDADFNRGDLASASDTLQQLIEREPNDVMLQLSQARVLILRNEHAQAEAILNDLRTRLPDSILVARTLIRLHVLQGNTNRALSLCNEVIDKLHNAAAHMLRAEVYLSLRRNDQAQGDKTLDDRILEDKALEDLGQAIALEPQRSDTWEARARVRGALGRLVDAIEDVRKALALAPDQARVQKLAAVLFIKSGRQTLIREADDLLTKALVNPASRQGKGDLDMAELGLLKARILVSQQATGPAIEEARGILRQITADLPRYAEAWEVMAQLELQQDDPSKALEIATRGLAHNEQRRELLLLKAMAEKRISPKVAALTTLPKLAEQYPGDVGILIEWADAYVRAALPERAVAMLTERLEGFTGFPRRHCEIALAAALYSDDQRDKANTLFKTLIVAEPNDPTPVMTLGQLLRKERRWTEVNQVLNLWRTTNPRDARTSTDMARILAGSGDREALQMAEDQLRMILDSNPDSVPTLVLLSMLMQDAGRDEEATRLNRRIIVMDPNNVIAINNLAWTLCENPNPSPTVLKEALDMANRGLAVLPEYADLLDTRGMIYYRLGELEKAVADFIKCIGLFPPDASLSAAPRFHLARAYLDMHHRAQAVEQLKEALTLNRRNVQLARSHAEVGRRTHAIKVLKDALSLQDQMDQFKTGVDLQDPMMDRYANEWTDAKLFLDQLQKGR